MKRELGDVKGQIGLLKTTDENDRCGSSIIRDDNRDKISPLTFARRCSRF
jgi:hypothetical protein